MDGFEVEYIRMNVEITSELNLSGREVSRLVTHSFHNIVNVLKTNHEALRGLCGNAGTVENSLHICAHLTWLLDDKDALLDEIGDGERLLEAFKADLETVAKIVVADTSFSPEKRAKVDESIKNIEHILQIYSYRAREAAARKKAVGSWEYILFEDIKDTLCEFLEATAQNSRGKFGVVYDASKQGATDYLVEFEFKGTEEGGAIIIPFMLEDCIRDLAANARKYSPPGGRIGIRLVDDGQSTTLQVSDTGRGIPESEIEHVVNFGVRGSNTEEGETNGGGYGLTKAYWLCKFFDGRMWIESAAGKGTTVTLRIPHRGVESLG